MALPIRDELTTRHFPWVTVALIAINVVVFLFIQPSAAQYAPRTERNTAHELDRAYENARFTARWAVIPCEVASGKARADHPKQCEEGDGSFAPVATGKSPFLGLLTSLFLHGSVEHIAGNMLFLWVFGNNVEDRLGKLGYLLFYLVGGVVASLGFIVFNAHSAEPLIGASGAIAAAMGAYLVFHPRGRVLTVVLAGTYQVVYLPAAVVLVLFFVTQFFTADQHVAWQAHAVGMGFGFLVALGLARLPRVRARAQAQEVQAGLRPWEAF